MALLTESSCVSRKSVQKVLSDNHAQRSAALDKQCVLFAANRALHKPIQSMELEWIHVTGIKRSTVNTPGEGICLVAVSIELMKLLCNTSGMTL